jgi:hypothetical protein
LQKLRGLGVSARFAGFLYGLDRPAAEHLALKPVLKNHGIAALVR